MTQVFAVFRSGYYRHGCGGIFASLESAKVAAEAMAAADCDDYHRYDVVPFTLDQRSQLHTDESELGDPMSPPIIEAPPVYSCRRLDAASAA